MDWTELLQDAAIVCLAISTVCNSVSVSHLRRAENFDSWMLDECRKDLSDLTACVRYLLDSSTDSAAGMSGQDSKGTYHGFDDSNDRAQIHIVIKSDSCPNKKNAAACTCGDDTESE